MLSTIRPTFWLIGLALGALLLIMLTPPQQPAPSGAIAGGSGVGGDQAAVLDGDVDGAGALTAAEAAKRLDLLKASRAQRQEQAAVAWVNPVPTARFTSAFAPRWGTFHYGIDLAAPTGTPMAAVGDGVVLKAGPAQGFGLAIYIQHENGDVTVYGHMYTLNVKTGDIVRAGQQIAEVGNNGYSTGPHLHLEVHIGGMEGQKVDPLPWLAERGVTIPGAN